MTFVENVIAMEFGFQLPQNSTGINLRIYRYILSIFPIAFDQLFNDHDWTARFNRIV